MSEDLSFLRHRRKLELPNFRSKDKPQTKPDTSDRFDVVKHKLALNPAYQNVEEALDLPAAFSAPRAEYQLPQEYEAFMFVIKSIRRQSPQVTNEDIREADQKAYEDALGNGLLFYATREVDDLNQGMSACGWTTRDKALESISRPAHRHAESLVPKMYEQTMMWYYKVLRKADTSVGLTQIGETRIDTY